MPAEIELNMFQIVVDAFNDIHKNIDVGVAWTSELYSRTGKWCGRNFSTKNNARPTIMIDTEVPIGTAMLMLINELTNMVIDPLGKSEELNVDEEYAQEVYNGIFTRYNARMKETIDNSSNFTLVTDRVLH